MRKRLTPYERRIMDALNDGRTPQDVATMLNVPLHQVQRLHAEHTPDRDGPHSMAEKLGSAYGSYWAQWQAAHPEPPRPAPKPEPPAEPKSGFDWTNRELSFDDFMNAFVRHFSAEARKDDGRGAA